MNITRMKILTGFLNSSNLYRCSTLFFFGCLLFTFDTVHAQQKNLLSALSNYSVGGNGIGQQLSVRPASTLAGTSGQDSTGTGMDFPKPKNVLYKSLMVPGWGQITNRQAWKVPIIYGLLGGLAWYSIDLTKKYHDYRAAYYNATSDVDDMRFGPTPENIPQDANADQLKSTRNRLRNRRDFIYIALGLAYGLNAVDAYVFAHMRSFDVSDDLSLQTRIQPAIFESSSPGLTLSVELHIRSKTR